MDRNTVTGLILIGLLLTVFAIFNQPSEEDQRKIREKQRKEQEKKDAAARAKAEKAKKEKEAKTLEGNWVAKLDEEGNPVPAGSGMVTYTDTTITPNVDTTVSADMFVPSAKEKTADIAEAGTSENKKPRAEVKDSLLTLESDKLVVQFNAKGGSVASVMLKEYESYRDFAKNDGKISGLTLFEAGDAVNELVITKNGRKFTTGNLAFDVAKYDSVGQKIVFEYEGEDEEMIRFSYALKNGQYDLGYDIKISGYEGKVSPQNVLLSWQTKYRQTEKLMSEQRRVSTVCYNYKNEGFSYLSEVTADSEKAEDDIEWVNFKQSYFSSFLHPEKPFAKSGSRMSVGTFSEGSKEDGMYIKKYKAKMNLGLSNTADASLHMDWYFGPNDYHVLASYDSDYDEILNYGWGIFRWINLYAVQPLFELLQNWGLAIGIAILFLTIILKLVLMPIQWKMYTSSAKMRILKPEIDELNAKYPNKEDAMKKQQEMMTLYRESGASPLAGCVPMLIQMPILLAVFRFFPSTFDLRQKGFLWAEDLSSYDSIATLGFEIPFYGDHVSLFTLLMAGTTLIYTMINQSNMTTPQQPGMPNMKYIMYFFPIMMIFFFNNYSSGLSYYYFISTLSSILIMIAIKRFFVDEEKLKAKMAARKAAAQSDNGGKGKKKSKFQERLEQMQKAQQEQQKARNQAKKKK
ncbi:MAG: membrane protein insertase YidC [Fluviicola sp. XM-24bin1]|nr:MAG: membrane protein insertase YidC [Fluviicola sp. XM-24bin1]